MKSVAAWGRKTWHGFVPTRNSVPLAYIGLSLILPVPVLPAMNTEGTGNVTYLTQLASWEMGSTR